MEALQQAQAASGSQAAKQEPQQRSGPGRVEEVRSREAFAALAPEWNALVRRTDDQLFYRHEFLQCWLDSFAPDAPLRVLTARDEGGALTAVLPLIERRESTYGMKLRVLASPTNDHSCRFDLVAERPAEAARLFAGHLAADDSWDQLRLQEVPFGGAAHHLLSAADGLGHPVGVWQSNRAPFITVPRTQEALDQHLGKNFRANLRRRRRKLQERGAPTVERIEGGPLLDERLREGFELERSGWKGENGTAISQDPQTLAFYTRLAWAAAAHGFLSLYFLRLGGRAVAFDFALTYGRRYLTLKAGYDEGLRECSPGQLLTEDALRECVTRGVAEFDLLGTDTPWKLEWASDVRPHAWLYVSSKSRLGRMLHSAKFDLMPSVKGVMQRFTG